MGKGTLPRGHYSPSQEINRFLPHPEMLVYIQRCSLSPDYFKFGFYVTQVLKAPEGETLVAEVRSRAKETWDEDPRAWGLGRGQA